MKRCRRARLVARSVVLCVATVFASAPLAQAADKKAKTVKAADSYDELFARYLEVARSMPAPRPADQSLWFNGLMQDLRARNVNDIVTVRVIESIIGTGTADSNISKDSNASGALPSFFGLDGKLPGFIDPTNLAGLNSSSDFKGAGSTTRASALTATLAARVAEVLPNGDLVIEGVREIDINGDRQIVVLTGIARVADIAPGNVVESSALGQLRIRYFGRGLMKDSLQPGWVIRILNKIF